jgi:6-phosphogluconolactonase (cycloisomerase 2 family)
MAGRRHESAAHRKHHQCESTKIGLLTCISSAARWVGVSSVCAVVLSLTGCTTKFDVIETLPPPPPPPPPISQLSSAYVANASGDSISMFQVSPAGLWSPTSPASVPVGTLPESLVVDPSGHFVYVPNARDNTVSMFTVNAVNGLLAPMSPATVPTGAQPQFIAVDPLDRFVYTANSNDNTISMFTITSGTGVLVPTRPATVALPPLPADLGPVCVTVDPTGHFVATCDGDGRVSMFIIDPGTGALTLTSQGGILEGSFAFSLAFDPTGRYLYVVDNKYNRLDFLTVNQTTGQLTEGLAQGGDDGYIVGDGPSSGRDRFNLAVSLRGEPGQPVDLGVLPECEQWHVDSDAWAFHCESRPALANPHRPVGPTGLCLERRDEHRDDLLDQQ